MASITILNMRIVIMKILCIYHFRANRISLVRKDEII